MLPLRRAHLFSSILLYGTTLLSLTPTVRSASKNFNFSSIYQSGPAGNASGSFRPALELMQGRENPQVLRTMIWPKIS